MAVKRLHAVNKPYKKWGFALCCFYPACFPRTHQHYSDFLPAHFSMVEQSWKLY